jgi:hypothetical protein
MPANYVLELGTGEHLHNPDQDSIVMALSGLADQEDSFAIVPRPGGGDEHYMQTAVNLERGWGWILEYRNGVSTQHYRAADDPLTAERVAAALYAYGTGDESWKKNFCWELVSFPQ